MTLPPVEEETSYIHHNDQGMNHIGREHMI